MATHGHDQPLPPAGPLPAAGGEDRPLRALEDQVRDLDRRVENNRLIRDTWTLIIFAIAVVALLAAPGPPPPVGAMDVAGFHRPLELVTVDTSADEAGGHRRGLGAALGRSI